MIKVTVKPMVITKVTTTNYQAIWFKRDFSTMSEGWVRGRSRSKNKMNRCFGCNWPFQMGATEQDGEPIHVVHFTGGIGNEVVCGDCLKKLFGDKADLEYWNVQEEDSKS
jgi:hypothetical protein